VLPLLAVLLLLGAQPAPTIDAFSFVDRDHGWLAQGSLVQAIDDSGPATAMQQKFLYQTDDGGATWTLISLARTGDERPDIVGQMPWSGHILRRSALSFVDAQHAWLATGRSGAYATDNAGLTWQFPFHYEETLGWVQLLSPGVGVALRGNGPDRELSVTDDNGQSWTVLYSSGPRP